MRIIPLQAIPNQTLSIQVNETTFDLNLHDCGDIMSISIAMNNTPLITGQRCVNGFPLLPYAYLESGVGNFGFLNANDSQQEYPYWTRFNADQILFYVSPEELAGLSFASYIQEVLNARTT